MKLAKKIAIYGFLAALVVPTIFAVPASAGCSKLIVGGARLCIDLPRNLVANKPPATLPKRALSGEPAELTRNHRPMAGLHSFIWHKSSR